MRIKNRRAKPLISAHRTRAMIVEVIVKTATIPPAEDKANLAESGAAPVEH